MKLSSLATYLLLLSVLYSASAFYFRVPRLLKGFQEYLSSKNTDITYHQVQRWFDGQILDHFNPQDNRTFSQRYWVSADSYIPGQGPIFLYICGEYTCPGVPDTRLFPLEVAQSHNALFVVLEHRFYGLSQPFQDLKTSSLAYLTVEQALEDLAYFIGWFKINSGYQITEQQPWITVGGSYPGALSAWFRYKYPHLTAGAWAASAVVDAILDFSNFDYQIYLSTLKSGPECPQAIQNLTAYFETQLYNTSTDVQQAFQARFGANATKLSREELLWYISDVFVESVQYGARESLCNFLATYPNFDELVNETINFIIENADPRSYGAYYLSNEAFNPNDADLGRQWNYQVCSQFGWMQTPASNPAYSMRSQRVNLDFYRQFCNDVYGLNLWPNPDLVNIELGGLNLQATNLIMTNGAEDPWQWASKLNSTGDITAIYIDCDDCGHCVELYTPNDSLDSQELKDARTQVSGLISQFLNSSSTPELIKTL